MALSATLGHFKLLEEIGHGGMGTVFEALDPTLDRHVAIKVLQDQLAHDPKFVEDFLREARNAAAISHPHIVQVHFCGEADGQYYVVMELLKGRTLREISEATGPLAEEHAVEITIQVADALRAAYHNNQMIHGDIKPANIFVTDDSGAKVLDFGLAKLANVEVVPTGQIWGSPYYMSPERVGQKAEDFRSDIYSLGATLFHVLTGRPPFDAETPEALILKRLNEKPPLLRELKPALTEQTEQVVNKMLSKYPLTRFRDYDHLLEQLQEAKVAATAKRLGIQVLTPGSLPAAPTPSTVSSTSPPARKFPVIPIAIGAGAAIAAIAGGIIWWQHTKQPTPTPPPTTVIATQAPPAVVKPPPPPPAVTTSAPPVTTSVPKPPPPKPPPLTPEQLEAKRQKEEAAKLEALRRQQELVTQETQFLQTSEAGLAPLWQTYDFLAVIARYETFASQVKTPEVKKLAGQRRGNAKTLADFKTQLITDITLQPYTRGDLRTKNGGAVAGNLKAATDSDLTFMTQYGELKLKWADLPPLTIASLAKFYADAPGASDPDTRKKQLAAFMKQYNISFPKPPPPPKTTTTTPPPKPKPLPPIKHLVK